MKHKGATMEYAKERMNDLMRAHDNYIASCRYICMTQLYETIVNLPAQRFYVSDIRASLVISALIRGENPLKGMCTNKKEMYREIYNRVITLQQKQPQLSILELCAIVVAQPAPKFYLTPGSAKIMICKYRKQWKREKQKNIRQ